jgi:thiamine biosynthesis lipoprotein
MQMLTFRAMGCRIQVTIDAGRQDVSGALGHMPICFEAWEQHLSRFRADSELMRLNRAAGAPVPVSETLWQTLDAALGAARLSDGLVSPALLDSLVAAGYDRSFESIAEPNGAVAPPDHLGDHPAELPADWRAIRVDPLRRSVHLPYGLRLDLGGTTKGWAADRTVRRLRSIGPTLIDAGGDIAVSRPQADGSPWPIAIDDPRNPGSDLALLRLDRGGVATSGRDYRRWLRGGAWRHHIIDPRTGQPAATDLLSVTVVAPTALEAETAAKAALILGSIDGVAWLDARPHLAGLLVMEDGQIIMSGRMPRFLWS